MSTWIIKEHPDFFKDLNRLGTEELRIFWKKRAKIVKNPEREKHLSGGENCYREAITKNLRLIYYIEKEIVWLMTLKKHDEAYATYLRRLYSLRRDSNKTQENPKLYK